MKRDQSRQGAVFINDHRFVDYPVFEQGKNLCQYKCFRNQERTVNRVHDGRFDRLAGIPVLVAEHFAHIGKTFEIVKGSVSHGKTEMGGMINILPDISSVSSRSIHTSCGRGVIVSDAVRSFKRKTFSIISGSFCQSCLAAPPDGEGHVFPLPIRAFRPPCGRRASPPQASLTTC